MKFEYANRYSVLKIKMLITYLFSRISLTRKSNELGRLVPARFLVDEVDFAIGICCHLTNMSLLIPCLALLSFIQVIVRCTAT